MDDEKLVVAEEMQPEKPAEESVVEQKQEESAKVAKKVHPIPKGLTEPDKELPLVDVE